jgi:hypothetical protein
VFDLIGKHARQSNALDRGIDGRLGRVDDELRPDRDGDVGWIGLENSGIRRRETFE